MTESSESPIGQVVLAKLDTLTEKLRRPVSPEMVTHGWSEEARRSMLEILEAWQRETRDSRQPQERHLIRWFLDWSIDTDGIGQDILGIDLLIHEATPRQAGSEPEDDRSDLDMLWRRDGTF